MGLSGKLYQRVFFQVMNPAKGTYELYRPDFIIVATRIMPHRN
jgi:hypothetical protein